MGRTHLKGVSNLPVVCQPDNLPNIEHNRTKFGMLEKLAKERASERARERERGGERERERYIKLKKWARFNWML